MKEPSYIRKKVRRALDAMIADVCSEEPGRRYAGLELTVEHEDGDEDTVTILVIHGPWVDYMGMSTQAKTGVEIPDHIDSIRWEGSD